MPHAPENVEDAMNELVAALSEYVRAVEENTAHVLALHRRMDVIECALRART